MIARRKFLSIAGGLTTAALLPGLAATAQDVANTRKPRLKKALKYSMIAGNGTPKEKLSLVAKLGFLGVEIDRPGKENLDDLKAAAKSSGVKIHGVIDSIHWNKPLSSPKEDVRREGLDALRSALKDAAFVGADTVLLVPGVVNKDVSYDECWERATAEIKKALPDAEKAGVKIAVETVWNGFITKPGQMNEFVDQFKSPWVGAYFDVSNMIKFGITPATWIRTLGKRMLKLDFKGYSIKKAKEARDDGKGFDVGIGEGNEEWGDVLKACAEVGYMTWATAEVKVGDAKWLGDVSERMTKILEHDYLEPER